MNKLIDIIISFAVLREKDKNDYFKYYSFIYLFIVCLLAVAFVLTLLIIMQFYPINYKQCAYILLPFMYLLPLYFIHKMRKEQRIDKIRELSKSWTKHDKIKIRNNGIKICLIFISIPLIYLLYILIRYYNQ